MHLVQMVYFMEMAQMVPVVQMEQVVVHGKK